MSKLVTPIEAVIEHVTDLKEGQYGIYKSVLFKTPDGEKIWKSFPPDSPEISILTKGAKVRLIPSGKTKSGKDHHVIELLNGSPNVPAPTPTKSATVADLTDDQKRQIAAYIEQMGALYRFAYGQAVHHLTGLTTEEESIRCAATTLFIAAQKRFNL